MNSDPSIELALGLMAGVLAIQRVSELLISRHHQRVIEAMGGVEFGRELLPAFVALHVGIPLAIALEVLVLGTRPGADWPWMLLLLVVAALLRAAAIRALGERWHIRVWVVPGEKPMTHGIYRWMRHPNYFAVMLECAALPLLFGAWRTAIGASLVNLVLLTLRIRTEEQALAWAAQSARASETQAVR